MVCLAYAEQGRWQGKCDRQVFTSVHQSLYFFFARIPARRRCQDQSRSTAIMSIRKQNRYGTKPGVAFSHSTRMALKKSAKSGKRSVLTLCSLCLPCCVRDFQGSVSFTEKRLYKITLLSVRLSVKSLSLRNVWRYRVEIQTIYSDLRRLNFLKKRYDRLYRKNAYFDAVKGIQISRVLSVDLEL